MGAGERGRRRNHLAGETSPYLLQHVENPVDWYPWGAEAIEKARREDRPIFLSIGYAACHWCHVMERESFEDTETAALLNRYFVSIKIDREERPDLDEIYMTAVQLMTRQGGWPLTVFLDHDLRPFFGGTYFPPLARHGLPAFRQVLERIRAAWIEDRDDLREAAARLTDEVRRTGRGPSGDSRAIPPESTARAVADLTAAYDGEWGGFGAPPKFPPDPSIALLLREHHRSGETVPLEMSLATLDRMALGGMFDQIGGGFARYSVDRRWLVPHFEKMLYNQALLVRNYVDAWRASGKPLYRRVVEETLDFVRRELTSGEGALLASLDADSEGVEGRFYLWTPAEVRDVLGAGGDEDDAALFCRLYDVTEGGNFEGRSIPNLLAGPPDEQLGAGADADAAARLWRRIDRARAALRTAREKRPRPATDDKILTSWNGLMIGAFAQAFQAFGRPEDLESARRAADFLLANLARGERLLATYRAGEARLNAYLDDYAFLGRGLLDLFESCFEPAYLERASALAGAILDHFRDDADGGFYFTSDDHEPLLDRRRSLHDGALPSGAGVAAELLLRLAVHLERDEFRRAAERSLQAARGAVLRAPSAHGTLLLAADLARQAPLTLALAGDPHAPAGRRLLHEVRRRFLPGCAVAAAAPGGPPGEIPLLAGRTALDGRPTAYLCAGAACRSPVTDPEELGSSLDELARARPS